MLRIAVCDDNSEFVKKIKRTIIKEFKRRNTEVCVEHYAFGEILIRHHNTKPFDVLFLDIDMPRISGFDIAKIIGESSRNCQVVFVTHHSELVYNSFKFRPLNFVYKANDSSFNNRISEVVDQILEHFKQETVIVLEDDISGRISVTLQDVLYIESDKHYVSYHLINQDNPITMRDSISRLTDEYSNKNFVRIHKKYLVNLKHIFNLDMNSCQVVFKQSFRLPMSKYYKNDIDCKLTEYLRRIR